MLAEEAEQLLHGKPLAVAAEDVPVRARALLARCLAAEIPAVIGACPKGG